MKTLATFFLGPPISPLGRRLQGNPHAEIVAKAFVYAWLMQAFVSFGPMIGDSRQIFASLANPNFDYDLFNGTFWKGVMAVCGILSTSPYEDDQPDVDLRKLSPPSSPPAVKPPTPDLIDQ
jgi:hypothetical protein